jgi:hypothetical protein
MRLNKVLHIVLVLALSLPVLSQSTSAASSPTTDASNIKTHHLYIIGDSLTVGPELFASLSRRVNRTKRWNNVIVDAQVGRSISQGTKVLRQVNFPTPTAFVVALGTNDLLSRRESSYPSKAINRLMRAANGRPVLWLNVEFASTRRDWRSRGVRFNKELRRAKKRYPNLEIADWDKHFAPKGPSRFIQDGIHLTVSGYKTRTTFMIAELNDWAQHLWEQSTTTTTQVPDSTNIPESPSTIQTISPTPDS